MYDTRASTLLLPARYYERPNSVAHHALFDVHGLASWSTYSAPSRVQYREIYLVRVPHPIMLIRVDCAVEAWGGSYHRRRRHHHHHNRATSERRRRWLGRHHRRHEPSQSCCHCCCCCRRRGRERLGHRRPACKSYATTAGRAGSRSGPFPSEKEGAGEPFQSFGAGAVT